MQSINKLIRIKSTEYNWVHNLLSIVKSDSVAKNIIINKQVDNYFLDILMKSYPEIDTNHTYSTLGWTIEMTKLVIKTNSEIKEDNSGSEYRLSWNE